MPTRFTGAATVSFEMPGTFETPRSAKNAWMRALACSDFASSKKIVPLAGAPFGKRERRRGFERIDDRHRRVEVAPCLAREFAPGGEHARERARGRKLVLSLARFRMRPASRRHFAREGRRTGREVALDDAIDQPGAQRVGGLDRLAGHAHLDRFLETDEPRQSLRSFGARDDAEIHLGLSHQRVGHGDAIVPGHRDLEAAAERRAVHRHDDRLGRVFDLLQQLVHLGCAGVAAPRQLLEPLDVGARDERPARADDDDGLNGVVCATRDRARPRGR